jgi:hypothetical protein
VAGRLRLAAARADVEEEQLLPKEWVGRMVWPQHAVHRFQLI